MAYTQRWTERVTPAGGVAVETLHEVITDDAAEQLELQREMAREARQAAADAAALRNIYCAPRGAMTLAPGDRGLVTMPDGGVLSIGATGEVYSDGRRLGTARAAKLVQIGKSVYARGATDGKWWRWTGSAWVETAEVDANLLVP